MKNFVQLLASSALCSACYGGGGVGGGVLLPSKEVEKPRAISRAELSHGIFGSRGAAGLEHALTVGQHSVVYSMDLDAKKFFSVAPKLRLYPELSLGLFEVGHDRDERLVGGFASPGIGAGAWWQVASDLALTLDAGAEYRVRPWDTSVPTVLVTVGVLQLAPLFQEGQGYH